MLKSINAQVVALTRDMRAVVTFAVVASAVVVLVASCAINQILPDDDAGQYEIKVIRVIDGDTIEAKVRGRAERIRLVGIDTPERGEQGWMEAKNALGGLLRANSGRFRAAHLVQEEPGKRDHYGRLLGYVESNGVDVGLELIRMGHAKYYGRFPFARENEYRWASRVGK